MKITYYNEIVSEDAELAFTNFNDLPVGELFQFDSDKDIVHFKTSTHCYLQLGKTLGHSFPQIVPFDMLRAPCRLMLPLELIVQQQWRSSPEVKKKGSFTYTDLKGKVHGFE